MRDLGIFDVRPQGLTVVHVLVYEYSSVDLFVQDHL